jgi:hypothetical protein
VVKGDSTNKKRAIRRFDRMVFWALLMNKRPDILVMLPCDNRGSVHFHPVHVEPEKMQQYYDALQNDKWEFFFGNCPDIKRVQGIKWQYLIACSIFMIDWRLEDLK